MLISFAKPSLLMPHLKFWFRNIEQKRDTEYGVRDKGYGIRDAAILNIESGILNRLIPAAEAEAPWEEP
jgi:hypothetical protein